MQHSKILLLLQATISVTVLHGAASESALTKANRLFERAQYKKAIKYYDAFLLTNPTEHETLIAEVSLSQCLIAHGLDTHDPALWARALPLFEQRLKLGQIPELSHPLLLGTNIEGKVIRVIAEPKSGLGDSITFLPIYCPLLNELGATVDVELPGRQCLLTSLIQRIPGVRNVLTQNTPSDKMPASDYQVYSMSLMGLFSSNGYEPTTEFTIPTAETPNITADYALVQDYLQQMDPSKVHVAVCWRASKNPVAGGTRIIDRDLPISMLTQLAEDAGYVKLWSIQGPPNAYVTESEFTRLEHQNATGTIDAKLDVIPDRHAPYISQVVDEKERPFENTAAAIAACQAFAGCDTFFPNLAGTMDQETYFLLKYGDVDMRWGTIGSTTKWFKKARLLRQQTVGDWTKPLAELTSALKKLHTIEHETK